MNDANDHTDTVDELTPALGHRFRRPELLTEALTHASAATRPVRGGEFSNERLEFLGDRVLALVIAEMLFETFGRETEGALARRLAALTRKEALAEVGTALDLGSHLQMSRSEADTGGRSHPGMVADACEAVIGALYLDAGIEPVHQLALRCFDDVLSAEATLQRDPKTRFQEWAHATLRGTPRYAVLKDSGVEDAEDRFTVEVSVNEQPWGTGSGRSKRIAESAAAAEAWERVEAGAGG